MQLTDYIGIAGLYCRLSRDDGTDSESNSIANQKRLLSQKAKELGFTNVKFYVDDGYTGTNFNRPGFQELLDDIEMGYISVVMVKDLSRLGRDYVSVGHYTDNYFPEHNIRFIAVNDMVDSDEGENEIAPFKNIMNEMYARDISRKIRSSNRIRGNLGEPLSQLPYGYMKSPENKKKWIIDPDASQIVKSIFRMCIEGKGNEAIAHVLQSNKIYIPMAYWHSKGLNRGGKQMPADPYRWSKTTVRKILTQQEYCGDVINFKTYSKNFKNKKRLMNAEENWRIFKDVHEPIIEREVFELVQENLLKVKRRAPKPENAKKHIFSGLIRCGDCRSNMRYHTNTTNKDIHYFSCGNYIKDTRGNCPTRHYIRSDALEQIVLLELKHLANFLKHDEERLAEILEKKSNKDLYEETRHLEGELQKALARQQKVANLYERLYEDNTEGKVTDEWFTHMSHKYELERTELKGKISDLRHRLSNAQETSKGKDMFLNAVRSFMEMQNLTAPLAKELIDHIDVYESEGKGKNKTQRIVIYYRFVGYIELPDKTPIVNDTRQGVAVNYISGTLPETA